MRRRDLRPGLHPQVVAEDDDVDRRAHRAEEPLQVRQVDSPPAGRGTAWSPRGSPASSMQEVVDAVEELAHLQQVAAEQPENRPVGSGAKRPGARGQLFHRGNRWSLGAPRRSTCAPDTAPRCGRDPPRRRKTATRPGRSAASLPACASQRCSSAPPVSDELWARVEDVRRARTRGGGPRYRDRVDLLGGLLVCVCGRQLRNDGTFADGRHRKLHADPCEAWGRKARLGDQTWEAPVLAQVANIALDDATIASVVAALGSSRQPVAIDRARIDRQMRELALEHAAGRLGDDTYLARLKALREQRDAIAERTAAGPPGHAPSSGCAPSASPSKPQTSEGEGRPDARHLRTDHGRRPRDRGCPADAGGLRARFGAGSARKG